MMEPKEINRLSEEIYISNLEEFEASPEEIEQILQNMEFIENFSFVDNMNILDY